MLSYPSFAYYIVAYQSIKKLLKNTVFNGEQVNCYFCEGEIENSV